MPFSRPSKNSIGTGPSPRSPSRQSSSPSGLASVSFRNRTWVILASSASVQRRSPKRVLRLEARWTCSVQDIVQPRLSYRLPVPTAPPPTTSQAPVVETAGVQLHLRLRRHRQNPDRVARFPVAEIVAPTRPLSSSVQVELRILDLVPLWGAFHSGQWTGGPSTGPPRRVSAVAPYPVRGATMRRRRRTGRRLPSPPLSSLCSLDALAPDSWWLGKRRRRCPPLISRDP